MAMRVPPTAALREEDSRRSVACAGRGSPATPSSPGTWRGTQRQVRNCIIYCTCTVLYFNSLISFPEPCKLCLSLGRTSERNPPFVGDFASMLLHVESAHGIAGGLNWCHMCGDFAAIWPEALTSHMVGQCLITFPRASQAFKMLCVLQKSAHHQELIRQVKEEQRDPDTGKSGNNC